MPKEASCILCSISRRVSNQQVAGRHSSPVFGSCQGYHVQLWAPLCKENIDLTEQDQLRDCGM